MLSSQECTVTHSVPSSTPIRSVRYKHMALHVQYCSVRTEAFPNGISWAMYLYNHSVPVPGGYQNRNVRELLANSTVSAGSSEMDAMLKPAADNAVATQNGLSWRYM